VEQLPRRQRIGAYAVVRRQGVAGEEILLTQMAATTGRIANYWTLPGGGIDHGEDPWVATVREVHEETGLDVRVTRIIDTTSTHWAGTREDGVSEDYHGVHLVFEAELLPSSEGVEPHVTEQDSSTQTARWVPVEEARRLTLLTAAAHVLGVRRVR
jgi:8-oxo-dGTP diphosphatase